MAKIKHEINIKVLDAPKCKNAAEERFESDFLLLRDKVFRKATVCVKPYLKPYPKQFDFEILEWGRHKISNYAPFSHLLDTSKKKWEEWLSRYRKAQTIALL